jgi:hypothetical protein
MKDWEVLFTVLVLAAVAYLAGLTLGLFLCPEAVFSWQTPKTAL